MRIVAAAVRSAVVALGVLPFVVAFGCNSDAVGVEACRQIEYARCRRAPACGIELAKPVHRGGTERDVPECIRYYDDACLHGLSTTTDPGAVVLQACVTAIDTGDCNVVKTPESHVSCAFLVPPAAPPPAADAAVEAADAAAE